MSFDERASVPVYVGISETRPAQGAMDVLVTLRRAIIQQTDPATFTLGDLIVAMQKNSFAVLILVFALLLVSPLSALPGATTLFGLTIALIVVQLVFGRQHVWLPRFLLHRPLPAQRTLAALIWLEKPVGWLDRALHTRLVWVVERPFALGPKLLVLMAALCAPLMEVIPASGTSVGAAITLFSASLIARDGIFVVVGAWLAAIMPIALWLLLT